jgi:NTE family protein
MPKAVGLVLGGGGARGWAHVGVLRALEDYDIPIDYLVGTSIGALVGAIYLEGALPKLEEFATDISVENLLPLMDVSFPGLGLIQGDRVRDFLSGYLSDSVVEDCRIPFRCVATNFLSKKEVVLTSGSLVDAVRASISIPGVFSPFSHNDAYLVDGGVVNPVPVSVAQAMGAQAIVAVNLNGDPKTSRPRVGTKSAHQGLASAHEEPNTSGDAVEKDGRSQEDGFVQGLVNRYEHLKTVLSDDVDDWIPDPKTGMNIFDVIGNSMNMMEQQVTRINLQTDMPDVLIEPDLLKFGIFDFQRSQSMIQIGYEAAEAKMSDIKELLTE